MPVLNGRFADGNIIAASAALVWAVHPLHTESVTYLSQRTECLMGLCYLATLYFFVRGVDAKKNARAWHALAILACFAGMACKEVMVTAPVAVLLFDRTFVSGSLLAGLRTRPWLYLGLFSSWIGLAGGMIGIGDRGVGFDLGVTPFQYALTESCVVLNYLKLAVWPAPLVFDYGNHTAKTIREVRPCLLLLVTLGLTALVALKRSPKIGFLLLWLFLLLAPTSSFVPVALQPMAEHRMYLPLVALAVGAILVFRRLLVRHLWIAVLPIIMASGTAAYRRNAVYTNEVSLWQNTVTQCPQNDRAHVNLATSYLQYHRAAEARPHLLVALNLNPQNTDALVNLGVLCAQEGRLTDAMGYLEQALHVNPNRAETQYNLGCVLLKLGRSAEAVRAFAQAIVLNPDYGDAHNNLGILLSAAGKFDAAIGHFSEAIRVNSHDAEAYANRASAHFKLNHRPEALQDYRIALQLRPDLLEVQRTIEDLIATPANEQR